MHADLFNYRMIDGRVGYTPDLNAICRLRYQVYVNEWGFEREEDHPAGLEQDQYDRQSIHFCAHLKNSENVIGAARIILANDSHLPIERNFEIKQMPPGVRRERTAEISRLAVSKEFRCQAIKRAMFGNDSFKEGHLNALTGHLSEFRRNLEHQLLRGLYLSIYRESKLMGLTHWFTVMARGLYVILRRWGISFTQIGPPRDYHGIRAPYLISLDSLEQSLARNNPALFKEAKGSLFYATTRQHYSPNRKDFTYSDLVNEKAAGILSATC